ncbi:MAG: DUF4389 domain-containing protein [Actinomycetota bacterium]
MAVVQNEFPVYPVRVRGSLDTGLSRWLWLVKWFLAIPHYIVLGLLYVAFFVLTVIAFFAILFTGRYPRSIFEFNVGVLRWSWRVGYYSYSALGTDRYPPFTLADVPDYPAHLDIQHPEHLSRSLVLVKWWLLAIPQYIVIALLSGGAGHVIGGAIGVLALVAAIILLVTATYPHELFDVILGLNRWVLRVVAYVALMTDQYPPFRVDIGPDEPGGSVAIDSASPTPGTAAVAVAATPATPATPVAQAPSASSWSAGRIVAVVFGAILVLPSLGLLAAGGTVLGFDLAGRDSAGYLNTSTETLTTGTYAIASQRIELAGGPDWVPHALGTVRIRVAPIDSTSTLFVGIGPTSVVERYLANAPHAVTTDFGRHGNTRTVEGTAAPASPATQGFWVASSTGAGARTVTWRAESGSWSVVAMKADGSPGVSVRASIGATAPSLRWIGIVILVIGFLFAVLSAGLLIGGIRRRR